MKILLTKVHVFIKKQLIFMKIMTLES